MMHRQYAYLTFTAAVLGMLLLAFKQEWIIIRYPGSTVSLDHPAHSSATKKSIRLVTWHNKQWRAEAQELLVPITLNDALTFIITTWIAHTAEQGKSSSASVQSVLLANNDRDMYLSFDKSALPVNQSVFEQWMFIEGLLRTIQLYAPSVQRVYFLVHHQPIADEHFDFSQPWPIAGFSS